MTRNSVINKAALQIKLENIYKKKIILFVFIFEKSKQSIIKEKLWYFINEYIIDIINTNVNEIIPIYNNNK